MNRSVGVVIVLAVVLVGGLYSLPRTVVSSQERKLTQSKSDSSATPNTAASPAASSTETHATSLSAEQLRTAQTLVEKLQSSTNNNEKTGWATKLAEFYRTVSKFDSVAKYTEVIAQIAPTEANMLQAGDRYYDAFSFSANEAKSANLAAKAREWYQKALDKNPNLLNAKANMAMTYVSSENPMQGIMMLREVIAADPTNELALFNLGLLSMRSNQYEKAVERFRQVLKLSPNNAKAQFYLGVSLAQTGKNKEALEVLQKVKATETDPSIQAAIAELEKELK
jgi:tetratricopeptide (TPR) repeat protein